MSHEWRAHTLNTGSENLAYYVCIHCGANCFYEDTLPDELVAVDIQANGNLWAWINRGDENFISRIDDLIIRSCSELMVWRALKE